MKLLKIKTIFLELIDYFFQKNIYHLKYLKNADYALNKLFEEENIKFKNYEDGILKVIDKFKTKIIIFQDINWLNS